MSEKRPIVQTGTMPSSPEKETGPHASFLMPFFKRLNRDFAGVWCVLHSYETLPYYSESDVDMAFSGKNLQHLESIINEIASQTGWKLYQKLWYDVQWCCYYVLRENTSGNLLAIDFLTDRHAIGRYGFRTTVLTQNCRQINNLFPVPDHETALCYKLVKRIEKGRSLDEDENYLKKHFTLSEENKISEFLEADYGKRGSQTVIGFLKDTRGPLTETEMRELKEERKKRTRHLASKVKYAYWESRRTSFRFRHPSGMVVFVPKLEKGIAEAFTELLRKKTGILFRYVRFERDASKWQQVKTLSGSTLLVCQNSNFERNKAVRSHGFLRTYEAIDSVQGISQGELERVTESYLSAILRALEGRISKKLHGHG